MIEYWCEGGEMKLLFLYYWSMVELKLYKKIFVRLFVFCFVCFENLEVKKIILMFRCFVILEESVYRYR